MSFIMFVVVGLSVGVVLHGIAMDRFRIGLPGALLMGLVAAFAGGLIGAAVAGHPLNEIRTATAGGSAIACYAVVVALAIAAHRRHLRDLVPRRHETRGLHPPQGMGPLGSDFR